LQRGQLFDAGTSGGTDGSAMKAFVDWVLARRYRLIILAAAFAPLLQTVTIALIALETLRRSAAQALGSSAIALLGLLVMATVSSKLFGASNMAVIGWIGVGSFAAGIVIGVLLSWARGLTPAFQATVLVTVVGVIGLSVIGPGQEALFAPCSTSSSRCCARTTRPTSRSRCSARRNR
jgi:hypothetical protein